MIDQSLTQQSLVAPQTQNGIHYDELRAAFDAALALHQEAMQRALAAQEQRMVRMNRQLMLDLRSELRAALDAQNEAVQAALVEQEERLTLDMCQMLADVAANRLDLQAALQQQEQRIASLRTDLLAQATQPAVELRRAFEEFERRVSGVMATPAALPAPNATSDGLLAAQPIIARCDQPGLMLLTVYKRVMEVSGWAIAGVGIRNVESLVDGTPRGQINYGLLRPDVAEDYPDYPNAEQAGFAGTVPVLGLEDGEHILVLRITAHDGEQQDLPIRFVVDTTWMTVGEVPDINADYPLWLRKHTLSDDDIARARDEAAQLAYQPLISIIAPQPSTAAALEALVASLQAQVYPLWELVLTGTGPWPADLTHALATADTGRVILATPTDMTISGTAGDQAASVNWAIERASGTFVCLLGKVGTLDPLATLHIVRLLNQAPDTDMIYADEDKVDQHGFRWDPFFKPDWSPDLLLSMDYISHCVVYRRTLLRDLGGVRAGFGQQYPFDLALRVAEHATRIEHIPTIVFSLWSSLHTPSDEQSTSAVATATEQAIAEALTRRQIAAQVEPGRVTGRWRVRYALQEQPGVTIIMPSGGKLQYLEPCLQSVLNSSTYPNLHVLVIDNSGGEAVQGLCTTLQAQHPRLRCERFDYTPFNYPAINNFAIQFVETPYVILLNDDITIITPDWVESLLEHAQRPEVGIVGPKLIFPNGTIQHAGVVLGMYENTGHAFKHFPADDSGYFDLPQVVRNCSAVTFACAMMRRSVYEEVGGLDQINLRVAFNDVDMCLRVRERGYWVVYTPHAVLYHHESVTKKVIVEPGESEYMREQWGHVIRHDPFYNPNLTRKAEDYSLNIG